STSHGGRPCSIFSAYAMAHKGKATSDVTYNLDDGPEAYSNPAVYSCLHDYTSMVWEVHVPEYDPSTEQIDPDVLMRVGGGKRHGWYWIADGEIDSSSTPTLSQTQLEEERRECLADQQRMAEMFQYMQSLGAAQGFAPPPPLFPKMDPALFHTP
ncbi:hypothetical protein ACJX0J_042046, partial [Zea mays]